MKEESESEFITINEIVEKYPYIKKYTIRYLIKTKPDFKERCVGRFGSTILINEVELLKYIKECHGYDRKD